MNSEDLSEQNLDQFAWEGLQAAYDNEVKEGRNLQAQLSHCIDNCELDGEKFKLAFKIDNEDDKQ